MEPLRRTRISMAVCGAVFLTGCAGGYGGPISGGSEKLPPSERRLQAVESRVAELSRRLDAVNLTGMDQDNLKLRDDLRQLRGEAERLRYEFDQTQKRSGDQYLDLDRRLKRFEAGGGMGGAAMAPPMPGIGGAKVEASGTVTTPPAAPPGQAPSSDGISAPVTISMSP